MSDFDDLLALATMWGMASALRDGIAALKLAATGLEGELLLPILLLVRRPTALQGSDSSIEHVGYVVPLALASAEPVRPEVHPLACFDDLSRSLLARLSGEVKARAWGLLGAESLGSKIAMHRARSGAAPEFVIDPGWLQPHNAARHALHASPAEDPRAAWLEPKAYALRDAIEGFAQTTRPIRSATQHSSPSSIAWLILALSLAVNVALGWPSWRRSWDQTSWTAAGVTAVLIMVGFMWLAD